MHGYSSGILGKRDIYYWADWKVTRSVHGASASFSLSSLLYVLRPVWPLRYHLL